MCAKKNPSKNKKQLRHNYTKRIGGSLRGVMVNKLDCDILICKFDFQSCYYVHIQINTLGERHEPSYFPS